MTNQIIDPIIDNAMIRAIVIFKCFGWSMYDQNDTCGDLHNGMCNVRSTNHATKYIGNVNHPNIFVQIDILRTRILRCACSGVRSHPIFHQNIHAMINAGMPKINTRMNVYLMLLVASNMYVRNFG